MSTDSKAYLIIIAISVCLLVGLIWLLFHIQGVQCERRWAESGLKSQYQVLGGCRVQRKDGTWVPSSTIRELSP